MRPEGRDGRGGEGNVVDGMGGEGKEGSQSHPPPANKILDPPLPPCEILGGYQEIKPGVVQKLGY